MANNELFGRQAIQPLKPVTADMATIVWGYDIDPKADVDPAADPKGGAVVTGATNITIQYQQQVVRRRTLASASGHPAAVIYPTQPNGSIQIQRLFAQAANGKDVTHDIFKYPGWNICNGTASLSIRFSGESAYKDCAINSGGFRMTGATVTGYNLSAEAEGLTVVDNVSIEFLQMFQMT